LKQFNVKGKGFLYLTEHSPVFAPILKCTNTSIKTHLAPLISTKNFQRPRKYNTLEQTNDLFWKNAPHKLVSSSLINTQLFIAK